MILRDKSAVERDEMIDGQTIAAGDALIAIASSGPHSNGYSLIRKVLDLDPDASIGGTPAREALLEPTRIYVKPILALIQQVTVKGMSHITGGGITENLPRVLPENLHAVIDTTSWQQGPVLDWLQSTGSISVDEMRRTFNCGVGMIIAVENGDLDAAIAALDSLGETAWPIGRIELGEGPVEFR